MSNQLSLATITRQIDKKSKLQPQIPSLKCEHRHSFLQNKPVQIKPYIPKKNLVPIRYSQRTKKHVGKILCTAIQAMFWP